MTDYPTRRGILRGIGAALLGTAAAATPISKAFACGLRTRGWVNTRCGGKIWFPDRPDEVLAEFPGAKNPQKQDWVIFDFGNQGNFELSIRRTIKVDSKGTPEGLLPNKINEVPLYVEDKSGGALVNATVTSITAPMHPNEGFYFRWNENGGKFAVIPVMNGRNVVNGQPFNPKAPLMTFGKNQNYVVVDNDESSKLGLPWLDLGIDEKGNVGQLTTSAPTHKTTSLEAKENPAMELYIIPMNQDFYKRISQPASVSRGVATRSASLSSDDNKRLKVKPGGMVHQHIPADTYIELQDPSKVWDIKNLRKITFSIPEAGMFYKLSGQPMPDEHRPLTSADYLHHKWYNKRDPRQPFIRQDSGWKDFVRKLFPNSSSSPALRRN